MAAQKFMNIYEALEYLTFSYLLAGANVDLSTSSGNISLSAGEEEKIAVPSVDAPSKRSKGSKVNAVFLAWHLPDMT